jgi:redox-sensitive bicupin YhaK (pirin superfamily)
VKRGRLRLVASPDGRDGSVMIHQDAAIYASLLNDDEQVTHTLRPGRKGWVQVARGAVEVNGEVLGDGDGAAIADEKSLIITARSDDAEFLLFDLP